MKRHAFPGGWYADATPSGAWAVLYPDSHINFSDIQIPLPPAGNVLFVVTDGVSLAGQGQADGMCWLWNGEQWKPVCPTYGTSPCAFGPGFLYVSMPGQSANIAVINPRTGERQFPITQPLGSRGIASVDPFGIHGQDAWYGQFGLGEFVDLQGIHVGQSVSGGCAIDGRLLEPGDVQFIRAHRDGDLIAVAMWKPQEKQAVCHWLTVREIAQLPLVSQPEPKPEPKPTPQPEPQPMPQGITDAQFETLVRIRAKYGETLTEDQIGALLNEVAWIHRSEGVGLQRKDSGTNCPQPRTGILIWRGMRFAGNIGQDVLGAASIGKCIPTRGEVGPADPAAFVKPVEPLESTPEPPKPPQPDYSKDIAEIEAQILKLATSTADILEQLTARVAALEQKPAPEVKLPKLRVQGSTSRDWGHSHKIDLEVVPE